ncbi:iron-containing alcohol dehydrogenase family protein [Paenibacillus whitsoniae]|nr:iron-containing alcohol dehydrogenase family protein [Paenibacillus whitsoniae]
MVAIKAPAQYFNEPGILAKSGELIAPYGKKALIITGHKALHTVRTQLLLSLQQAGVEYAISQFEGKVTTEEIATYTSEAIAHQAELLIGIGGGKALDITKVVGEKLRLPVVAVPTIAATCASWAALSVIYDDQGRSSGYLGLTSSPVLVLADTQILVEAPRRYLAAGIGDTIVKWYETVVNVNDEPEGLDIRISTQISKLALDRLHTYALQAIQTAGTGTITPAFKEAVDAVIVLAGLAGTVQGGTARAGIAHSLDSSLTHFPQTSGTLHGERVAFGLLTQTVLEKRPAEEIERLARLLISLKLPVTLKQLGFEDLPATVAPLIAAGVPLRVEAIRNLSFEVTPSLLHEAILQTDQLGLNILQGTYITH